MNITRFVCNMVRENTYLIDDGQGEAALIDCGALYPEEQQAIARHITEHHLHLAHLLNTHGHFDHIFGVGWASNAYGIGLEISSDERSTYENAAQQMQLFMGRALPLDLAPVAHWLADADEISVGTLRLQVIATPGHTPGGICFYLPDERTLFSGDSLFRHEIGRCDLPGGNLHSLVGALKERILALPDDVTVLPGHGDATTIADERRSNPYLR